jgi:glycosyltransferase
VRISVITVTFNSADTISETLASIRSQTHPDIEHIVIDGASTDATLQVLDAHPREGRRVLSEPDSGIYDAMNKGLALASGDFVGFLNADDMLDTPDTLTSIASAAAKGDIDAVFGDLVYVRQDRPDTVLRHWRCGAFAASRLRFGWMPPHPTFYVRRSLLAQIGQFDTRLRIAADYDFMLRCLRLPGLRVAYVPQVLVKMRMGGVSNRSLQAMLHKSREDLDALRRNSVGGVFALICKNLRKLPQFFGSS